MGSRVLGFKVLRVYRLFRVLSSVCVGPHYGSGSGLPIEGFRLGWARFGSRVTGLEALTRGSIYTTIMELGPKRPPNSIIVVVYGPSG